jgi:hypothetical protein
MSPVHGVGSFCQLTLAEMDRMGDRLGAIKRIAQAMDAHAAAFQESKVSAEGRRRAPLGLLEHEASNASWRLWRLWRPAIAYTSRLPRSREHTPGRQPNDVAGLLLDRQFVVDRVHQFRDGGCDLVPLFLGCRQPHGQFECVEIMRRAKPATDGRFDLGVCRFLGAVVRRMIAIVRIGQIEHVTERDTQDQVNEPPRCLWGSHPPLLSRRSSPGALSSRTAFLPAPWRREAARLPHGNAY